MNFSSAALNHIEKTSQEMTQTQTHSNYAPKLMETADNSDIPITMRPLYKTIKGYSLFRQITKLEAIVDFLQLSSHTSFLLTQDLDLVSEMRSICDAPAKVIKGMKGPGKFPSKRCTGFTAKIIIEVVKVIEKDRSKYNSQTARKRSSRKSLQSSLPPAAAKLVTMVEKARLRIQGEIMKGSAHTQSKKRKSNTELSVDDLLLKGRPVHDPNFVEVEENDIESNLLCPQCNHRSLISATTKAAADAANKVIEEKFEKKLQEWEENGRVARKPRMDKTQSQILGCVCFMQNCIGNSDGSGCFHCKSSNGCVSKKQDEM